jgi:hypothetical protein
MVFAERKEVISDKQKLVYEEMKNEIINRNWIILIGSM